MSSSANVTLQNTTQLVEEFKKSGEFDRLRRQLLTHFTNNDDVLKPLMTRIEEISKEKLAADKRLEIKMKDAIHSELMQEIEKYPMIPQSVLAFTTFADEAFLSSIEQYLGNIVHGENTSSMKLWHASPSQLNPDEEGPSANAVETELENGEVIDDKPMKT